MAAWNKLKEFIMALFDVDKVTAERGSSSPNHNDALGERMAHSTISTTYVPNGIQTLNSITMNNNQILGQRPDKSAVLFIGQDQTTGREVVKIAKDGFDARTASPDNLQFNSDQDTFKITDTGTVSVSIPNASPNTWNQYSATLLNFSTPRSAPPYTFGSMTASGVLYTLPMNLYQTNASLNGLGGAMISVNLSSDVNGIYALFGYYANGSGAPLYSSVNIRYYVLQETAATS